MENEKETWAGYVGGLILIIIFGTLALVAAGGWNWFAKFLENSAPAWLQAFGSIFAIIASFRIANKQYARQIIKEEATANQIAKHRNDILYFSIDSIRETCLIIEEKIDESNNPELLDAQKNMYIESRSGLNEFPILEIRNPELALAVLQIKQLAIMGEKAFFPKVLTKRSGGLLLVANACSDVQKKSGQNLTINLLI